MVQFIEFVRFGGNGNYGILKIIEFLFVRKIEMAPFLLDLGPIFARNLGISRKQWVVRARQRLHCVSHRILHKDRALLQKF